MLSQGIYVTYQNKKFILEILNNLFVQLFRAL